jgi:hypothetical protein
MEDNLVRCTELREALPAYVHSEEVPPEVARHLAGCPDCRAELDRYESLLTAMNDLRTETVAAPPGLVTALNAIPATESRLRSAGTHVIRHRRAYGGAALAVAGAAGALLWRNRRLAAA